MFLVRPIKCIACFTSKYSTIVGQTPYHSKVTVREEWLPVAVGIVGAKGDDTMLPTLIKEVLQNINMETSVRVGETAYEVKPVNHETSRNAIPVFARPGKDLLSLLSGIFQFIFGRKARKYEIV